MVHAAISLICLALVIPVVAQAQIILCKDENGKTYSADRPIPECQGRELRQYGKSANVVRVIPAPLTAEERSQQQLEAEKKREIDKARREQQRQDQALLATYRDEDAIIAAREQAAAPLYEMIKHEKGALSRAEERRNEALTRQAQAEENKAMNAAEWKRRAEAAEMTVKASSAKLQAYEAELAQLRGGFEARIKRFRELKREEGVEIALP